MVINDILQLNIKIYHTNLNKKIENLKKKVSQKIIQMNLQNKKKKIEIKKNIII